MELSGKLTLGGSNEEIANKEGTVVVYHRVWVVIDCKQRRPQFSTEASKDIGCIRSRMTAIGVGRMGGRMTALGRLLPLNNSGPSDYPFFPKPQNPRLDERRALEH